MNPEPNLPREDPPHSDLSGWKEMVLKYQRSSVLRASWQLVNSVGTYLVLWGLIYLSLSVSYWLTALLAIVAGGVLVRVFIIFHDCGHGSFFKSRRANDITGMLTGLLTFTPYHLWRWEHALHHSTSGDLDRRGIGDVPTMTVEEYLNAGFWTRLGYRFVRNPFVLFGVAPLVMFLLKHRFALTQKASLRDRWGVHATNLAIVVMVTGMSLIFGLWPYLIIQVAIMGVAGSAGTWLFYVQHQFEGAYWERNEDWDFAQAALQGSSFYKLPRILQWFSGNIGFHHIHHLSPRIPNYNLEKCHDAEPLFQKVPAVTLRSSMKSLTYRFWDEEEQKLVGNNRMRVMRDERKQAKIP